MLFCSEIFYYFFRQISHPLPLLKMSFTALGTACNILSENSQYNGRDIAAGQFLSFVFLADFLTVRLCHSRKQQALPGVSGWLLQH
jgi:hypothetical protein